MTITVKYFGSLTDITRTSSEQFTFLTTPFSLYQLKNELSEKYPSLNNSNFRVAHNQQIISEDVILNSNDVVALLPPFSGG